jgi:hypothetical protein
VIELVVLDVFPWGGPEFSTPIVTMSGAEDSIFRFLKKQTRAHKYLNTLTKAEIEEILARHVPRLTSLHIFTTEKAPPEVYDEYMELRSRVVARARQDLQSEFMKKIPKSARDTDALKHYMLTL